MEFWELGGTSLNKVVGKAFPEQVTSGQISKGDEKVSHMAIWGRVDRKRAERVHKACPLCLRNRQEARVTREEGGEKKSQEMSQRVWGWGSGGRRCRPCRPLKGFWFLL